MTRHEWPAFLRGTFSWSHLGYSFSEQAPVELLEPAALNSDNPWLVVAAVLEHAKRGNHDPVRQLFSCCNSGEKLEGFEAAALAVIGDAGRESDLLLLQTAMEQGSDEFKTYAANAASMAGKLWLVPSMMEAWKSVDTRNDHERIGYAICRVLEGRAGPISEHAGTYDLAPLLKSLKHPGMRALAERRVAEQPDMMEFERLAWLRFDELQRRFDDQATLWEGEPFSVTRLVERMHAAVRDAGPGFDAVQKFEATTGVNCSSFYRDGELQRSHATAVLDRFLETGHPERYAEGERYFFGHRIPD